MCFSSYSVTSATCPIASRSTSRQWIHSDLPFRLLLDHAKKFQRLGYLTHSETTYTERRANQPFIGQSIAGDLESALQAYLATPRSKGGLQNGDKTGFIVTSNCNLLHRPIEMFLMAK